MVKKVQANLNITYLVSRELTKVKPGFASHKLKQNKFSKNLPPVGMEPTPIVINSRCLPDCTKSLFGCQSESLTPL